MTKKISFLALILCLAFCASSAFAAVSGTYAMHMADDDWGCGVDKVILTLAEPVEGLSAETVSVVESKEAFDWATFSVTNVESTRNVKAVYACDAEGSAVEGASANWAIEMNIDPNEGNPLASVNNYNMWSEVYALHITDANIELDIEPKAASFTTTADAYALHTFDATDANGSTLTYKYGLYKPETETKTLFVWLHGMGEGGYGVEGIDTDPRIAMLAVKGSAVIGEEFQSLMGGTYVLVPQCPTVWMDDGSGEIVGKAESIYTESLHALIASVREEIGAEKVIVAGCSNGGYMTMLLAVNYGEEYDAYVPICEALADELITDEQIAALAKLPMFFIYAQDDPLVVPETYEIPTIARLQAAGAEDLHVFAPEHVVDTTGRFPEDIYFGHGSWRYFFSNDAVDENGVNCWAWMAQK